MTGKTITVQRGTTSAPGRRNDTSIDWTNPAEHDITGCHIAPRPSTENNDGRSGVIVGHTVFAPPGADVRATDRLIIRGEPHEVEGRPSVWHDPEDPSCDGVEITATFAEG